MLEFVKDMGTTKQPTREEALRSGKLKWFSMSMQCFVDLLRQGQNGRFYKCDGMPEDAMILDISEHYMFLNNQLAFRVWSDTFPAKDGAELCDELVITLSLYQEPKQRGREFI